MEWTETNSHTDAPSKLGRSARPQVRPIGWRLAFLGKCASTANQTQRNLWINVPHLANAVYVKELAGLIHERLDPNLVVYLEHSNEVWNGLFGQFQDNHRRPC